MGLTLAIDFGSTFTKVVAIDLDKEDLVGVAQAASTVDTDITIGLHAALRRLRTLIGVERFNTDRILSCSSAAGGLRIVVAGLVSELTTKAAKEAALGAGAKVVGIYSYGLSPDEVKCVEQIAPDLILLTGGTDGGNEQIIIHNAAVLAASQLNAPMIVAGNKMATHKAQALLEAAGKYTVRTENVLPELNRLNVEPTRAAIRDIFMQRITHAKGLDKAQAFAGHIIMPTPMAVLRGASLLASGVGDEKGLGELIVVDVGGATTDVYSIAHGHPSHQDIIVKGLPEPYEKRTVEGDLGIRYNAQAILDIAGSETITEKMRLVTRFVPQRVKLEMEVKYLSNHIDAVPQDEEDFLIDIGLASTAVDIASRRHAGRVEESYFPSGKVRIQYGKDLTGIKCVIGTGGIFAYGQEPHWILKAACHNENNPESFRPIAPEFFVDERYILYAVGLLAEVSAVKAVKIIKKHLRRVNNMAS